MALTLDYINLIVHSDASITDMVSFHGDLRDVEASMFGILYPVVHSYKQLPIGGGAFIPGIIFLNGWSLEFPAGDFEVRGGQIDVTINPVDDCYVKITQAGAYAVTSIGSTGLTSADISAVASEVLSVLNATTIPVNTKKINDITVGGVGSDDDPWGPA